EHEDRVVPDALNEESEALLTLSERLFGEAALGQVAGDFGEPNEMPGMVSQRGDDHVCPEATAILADAPTLVLEPSNPRRFLELELGKTLFDFLARVKDREMFSDHFVRGVALEALRAGVPAQDVAVRVERENGVVADALDEQAMELAGLVRDAAGRLLVRRRGGIEWALIAT